MQKTNKQKNSLVFRKCMNFFLPEEHQNSYTLFPHETTSPEVPSQQGTDLEVRVSFQDFKELATAFWFRGMISPNATQSMVFRASFRPAILRSWKIQQVRSKQGSWRESSEGHHKSIQVLRNRLASYEWVYLSTKGIRMTISEEDTLVFKIQGVQPGIQIYSKWYTLSSPSPNLSLKVQLLKKKRKNATIQCLHSMYLWKHC